MFCRSLRTREAWKPAVAGLSRNRWKETSIETHDIAFSCDSSGDACGLFRLVLVTATEVDAAATVERIERLHLLNGGRRVAVVLLVAQDDPLTALNRLQIRLLSLVDVPIIPLLSATELPACLEDLRKRNTDSDCKLSSAMPRIRDLLPHCVRGRPMSETQTNIVSDLFSSFKELAFGAFDLEAQHVLLDYLGEDDSHRLLSFLTDGPKAEQF